MESHPQHRAGEPRSPGPTAPQRPAPVSAKASPERDPLAPVERDRGVSWTLLLAVFGLIAVIAYFALLGK